MANDQAKRPEQPTETVQRRPTDALWFAVLLLSVATGIGMTIFAPVGDAPPPAGALPPATLPTFEPATAPSMAPIMTPALGTQPATTPAP